MSFHIWLSFEFTIGGIIPFCGIPVSETKIKEKREYLNILTIIGNQDIFFLLNYIELQINKNLNNFTKINIKALEIGHAITDKGLEELKKFINALN